MARQKSLKKPGSQIPLKLKENEPEHIVAWFNAQDTIAESLRYLIEKDIAENGVRDVKEEMLNTFLHYKPQFRQSNVTKLPMNSNVKEEQSLELNRNDSPPPSNEFSKPPIHLINEDEKGSQVPASEVPRTQDEPLEQKEEQLAKKEPIKEKKTPQTSNADDLDIDDLNVFG